MIPPNLTANGTPSQSQPLPAGAIRVRRSGLLAAGVVTLGVVIAAAGVMSGLGRHAPSGPRPELAIAHGKPAAGALVSATAAQPLSVGAEPGAPVISEPQGGGVTRALTGPLSDAPPTHPRATPREAQRAASPDAPVLAVIDAGQGVPTVRAAEPDGNLAAQGCAGAATRLDAMLCADPGLAAQDRRVRRAFRALMQAADDPEAIAADQARFRDARDRAAAHNDREALQELYQQRLQDLTQP